MIRNLIGCLLMLLACTGNASTDPVDRTISEIRNRWAEINYQLPEKEKEAAFKSLVDRTLQAANQFPGRAEPLVWRALALLSYGKSQGMLSALGKAKEARGLLLEAEKINPTALDGASYMMLGVLYGSVPGKPFSFGDKKLARQYFEKCLAINPRGIDINYFYGEFLREEGETAKAAERLKLALEAPPRPGREIADAGRRAEIKQALANLKNQQENAR